MLAYLQYKEFWFYRVQKGWMDQNVYTNYVYFKNHEAIQD